MSFTVDLKPVPEVAVLRGYGRTIVRTEPFRCGWCGANFGWAWQLVRHVVACREES
jgi:predicted 3-demethylubiquinone-9 3-methyltransferase (glyoxalase superfamily)